MSNDWPPRKVVFYLFDFGSFEMKRSQRPDSPQPSNGQAESKGRAKRRRSLGFMALEPRIMYDGAAAATAAHHRHHHDGGPSADPSQVAAVGPNDALPSVSAPAPS